MDFGPLGKRDDFHHNANRNAVGKFKHKNFDKKKKS